MVDSDDLDKREKSPDDRYSGKYNDPDSGQYGSDTPGHYGSDSRKSGGESAEPGKDLYKPGSPEDVAAKEKKGASGGNGNQDDAGDAKYPGQVGRGYTGAKPDAGSKVKNLLKNRKKLLLLGGIPGLLALLAILFLTLLFPAFKIQQLAFHIEEYRLVRLTRTFYKQASLLTSDRAAIDATGSDTGTLLKDNKTGVLMASLRPRAVVDNMKATGVLDFGMKAGPLGTEVIDTVKLNINGQIHTIKAPQYKIGRPIQNYKARVIFASQLNQGVHDALRGNNYLVRSRTAKLLLSGWGIHYSWYVNKGLGFLGLSQDKADQLMLQETIANTTTPAKGSKIPPVDDAAKEANQEIAACAADAPCAKELIATGELPTKVTSRIDKMVNILTGKGTLPFLLKLLSPVYAIGMPLCIIFDGSVEFSDAFVNSQNIAATKTFMAIAAADSQQKTKDVTAQAVGAFNRRIGDIANSIPEKLARGEPIDTTNEVPTQAAKSGEFTIFDALFPPGIGSFANTLARALCPTITNTEFNIGAAVVSIIAAFLSGGSSYEAGQTIRVTIEQFAKHIVTKIAEKFTTPTGRAALKNTGRKYAASTVRGGAETAGLTYLARMLVLAEMGAFYNGTGTDVLANQGDSGAVAFAQENQRRLQFGRPLTNPEVKVAQAADNKYIAQQKGTKSSFERYFALSNPDSVAASVAVRASELKMSSVANFFINIPRMFGIIFSPLTHSLRPLAAAATTADTTNYGIVQWGWSAEEEALIDGDASFDPLENAQIVKDSGQAEVIQTEYGKCFTSEIGPLLTDGSVVRDSDGNLLDNGSLCSPTRLGPSNSEFGDKMIFRWRLDNSYQNTLQELLGIQNATSTSPTTGTPGACPSLNDNKYQPTADECKWIAYIYQNVLPLLPGSTDQKAAMAADVTWWALREQILQYTSPENPVGSSNCGTDPNTGKVVGNFYLSFTQNCTDTRDDWQLGIGGVHYFESGVKAKALELHPGKTVRDIITQVAADAGHPGDAAAINAPDGSRLQVSLLLRDPATGFYFEDGAVLRECVNGSGCIGGSYSPADKIATDHDTIIKVIGELKTYYQGGQP